MIVRLISGLICCIAPVGLCAADNEDFNPYKNAKVGDFATYKVTVKFGTFTTTGTTTQTVIEKNDKVAVIKVVASVAGMETPAETQTIDLTKPYDPTKAVSGMPQGVQGSVVKMKEEGAEKITVGTTVCNTKWNMYEVKAKPGGMDLKSQAKVWMAKEIPLGLVKLELKGDITPSQEGAPKGEGAQKFEVTLEATETGTKKQ